MSLKPGRGGAGALRVIGLWKRAHGRQQGWGARGVAPRNLPAHGAGSLSGEDHMQGCSGPGGRGPLAFGTGGAQPGSA